MAKRLIFISDVHIGINAPTNWYQQSVHEPFLLAALDYVRQNAAEVAELILLGDLVDQWTYPPDVTPPSFAAIAAANPNLFGAGGALAQTLTALDGRMTYVPGNHDMAVTAAELASIRDAAGRTLRIEGLVYEPPTGHGQVVCTHGHIYSMFNAPDFTNVPTTGLPLGHVVTRLSALWSSQRLQHGQAVVDQPDSGNPTGWALEKDALITLVKGIVERKDRVAQLVVNELLVATGQPDSLPITLLDGTRTTPAIAANQTYHDLMAQWEDTTRFPPGQFGSEPALFALLETDMDNSLTHFAEILGEQKRVVVMGHTHAPLDQGRHPWLRSDCIYANSGFNCPSIPDMTQPAKRPVLVEVVVDDDAKQFTVNIRYVTSEHVVAPQPLFSDTVSMT